MGKNKAKFSKIMELLEKQAIKNLKFGREQTIGEYIVDFVF